MLEEIVGSRYTAVGTAENDDFLLGSWGGVLRHLPKIIQIWRRECIQPLKFAGLSTERRKTLEGLKSRMRKK